MPKRILVFCDGTGADANAIDIPTGVGVAISKYATNVVRLARAVNPFSADGSWQQIVFYQSGVGSVTGFDSSTVTGTTVTQATGLAVASKIREAYAFIAQNYQDGDEICLFGFSRGAYTARKIAGLIDVLGLLPTENLGLFFTYWGKLANGEKFPKPGRDTKIKCVGVWDTVGSILRLADALNIKDNELPASVITALQAVSLQENRSTFLPTLWVEPKSGLAPGQSLTEVWFAGAHSDVGGGYERHELADLALFWMADKLTYPVAIIDLNLDFITRCKQPTKDAWGNTKPNNAWKGFPFSLPKTRLSFCESDAYYHQSLLESPTSIRSTFMITLDDLKEKFSTPTTQWQPTCPDLGPYETERKNHWNDENKSPITFEPDVVLFDPVLWVKTDLAVPIAEMIQLGNYNNVAMCVARVLTDDGMNIYPGMAAPHIPRAWYGTGGGSGYSTTEYEVLIGREKAVRWVHVTGELNPQEIHDKLVSGGYDSSDMKEFYIARFEGNGGKVKAGEIATYTKVGDGPEFQTSEYDVLVYNNDLEPWMPSSGDYGILDPVSLNNSQEFTITKMTLPPVVAVGLKKLHLSKDTFLRIIAFADEMTTSSFNANLNTWNDTILYAATLSWITLAENDPRYQCGYWTLGCDPSNYATPTKPVLNRTITERVNFGTGFVSQPKVFVGISGVDLSGEWYLSVTATDIDIYGFTINVLTGANTALYGIKVDWVAYRPDEANIWNGNVSYNPDKPAHTVDFGIHFLNQPTVFTAITQFDISNEDDLRINVDTDNITNSGADIIVSGWGNTVIRSATAAYLALDTHIGA